MTVKKITIMAVAVLLVSLCAVLFALQDIKETKVDAVAVNDISESLAESWQSVENNELSELPCLSYGLDYVVLDKHGKLLAKTKDGLNENLSAAIKNRDTVVDISVDDTVLGKLLVYNNSNIILGQYRDNLRAFCIGLIAFLIILCVSYAVFIDMKIFRPFRKLKDFAKHVAAGNFDIPLEMDRGNQFGAFTESFDLMRDELAKAKESERLANQSKKELVASLSHDIKTPVASIKAVSEVMMLEPLSQDDLSQLKVIDCKADQINTLITNMFNATLHELQVLSVTVTELPSTVLKDFIKNADYNNRAVIGEVPECMILADKQRLMQVIDNIISNSYKYADTSISITANQKGEFLELEFRDYGKGVLPDEVPLLFHKFYRAQNASEKSGAGLGLYISKYFMEKMSGEIACRNTGDGFAVVLKLLLA